MAKDKKVGLDYINQTQAAEILGISRMTIWQWLKEGKIQAHLVGGFRMIPMSEIERIKNNQAAEV